MKLWIELGYDDVTRNILGLPGTLFSTVSIELPTPIFSGSSRCVKPSASREFFRLLSGNMIRFDSDSEEVFNLASIGVRYAASLLLGTRSFEGSANFESASFSEQVMMISEKATSIPAGIP